MLVVIMGTCGDVDVIQNQEKTGTEMGTETKER
jgi:hypothetical protein